MSRIDKYLWAVRLSKTRSQGAELVKAGKVLVNEQRVKASREIKIGEIISVKKNASTFSYKILEDLDKRVGAKLVANYILDITPAEEIEKYKEYQAAQEQYREFGLGRPTKKNRRDINRFLNE